MHPALCEAVQLHPRTVSFLCFSAPTTVYLAETFLVALALLVVEKRFVSLLLIKRVLEQLFEILDRIRDVDPLHQSLDRVIVERDRHIMIPKHLGFRIFDIGTDLITVVIDELDVVDHDAIFRAAASALRFAALRFVISAWIALNIF